MKNKNREYEKENIKKRFQILFSRFSLVSEQNFPNTKITDN